MSFLPESDILLVGEAYRVLVLSWALRQLSPQLKITHAIYESPQDALDIVVGIGNGDDPVRAQLTFGKNLFHSLWNFSQGNFETTKRFLRTLEVSFQIGRLWRAEGGQHDSSCLGFSRKDVVNKLLPGLEPRLIKGPPQKGSLVVESDYQYLFRANPAESNITVRTSLVVIASEFVALEWLSELTPILIPITISHFFFPSTANRSHLPSGFQMALFNGGADYAVTGAGGEVRVGSFRNLFQDRGVGFRRERDDVALSNLGKFFFEKGWINQRVPKHFANSWETVSCDGVPVVGTSTRYPGIYFCGGFGTHTDNFYLELAEVMARGILGKADFSPIAVFSNRRLLI